MSSQWICSDNRLLWKEVYVRLSKKGGVDIVYYLFIIYTLNVKKREVKVRVCRKRCSKNVSNLI